MARLRSRTAAQGQAEARRDTEADDEKEEPREEHEEREEEEAEEEDGEEEEQGEMTEYEKQRLKTIERNKAMLASLQLPALASALAPPSKARSASKSEDSGARRRSERLKFAGGKTSAVDNDSSSSEKSDSEAESLSPNKRKRKDQEYEPTDDSLSESEEDEMDEHEEAVLKEEGAPVDMDDEEYALQQALALSLGESVEATDSPASSKKKKKRSPAKKMRAAGCAEVDSVDELEDDPKPKLSKGKAKRKNQKMSNKRHFTEGEVDALFSIFDERGRGLLTLNDLERVSTTHDFTWSAEELLDMIHLFNRNHNGALDLVDFRNVAGRCNLIISEREACA